MFFLWMLVNIVLLSSGGYVFLQGNQQAGWILIGVGVLSLIMWVFYYRNRKKRGSSNDSDVCWAVLTALLEFIPCHRRCDRSIHIKGKPMPLCARCTGIVIGCLSLPVWYFMNDHFFLFLGILAQFPLLIDGFTQLWKWRASTNILRILTGVTSGIGLCLLAVFLTRWLSSFFL